MNSSGFRMVRGLPDGSASKRQPRHEVALSFPLSRVFPAFQRMVGGRILGQPRGHPLDDAGTLDHLAHEDGTGVAGQAPGAGFDGQAGVEAGAKGGSVSPMA